MESPIECTVTQNQLDIAFNTSFFASANKEELFCPYCKEKYGLHQKIVDSTPADASDNNVAESDNRIELEVLKNSWIAEYKGNAVNDFSKYLELCYSAWDPNDYYSAYSAIVTGSMMGKSRLTCEVHRVGIFPIILCLRPKCVKSIPERTPIIADLMLNDDLDVLDFTIISVSYILACLDELLTFLEAFRKSSPIPQNRQNICKQWLDSMIRVNDVTSECDVKNIGDDDVYSKIAKKMKHYQGRIMESLTKSQANSPAKSPAKSEASQRETPSDPTDFLATNLVNKVDQIRNILRLYPKKNMNSIDILFVFDEARHFLPSDTQKLNKFYIFRKLIGNFPHNHECKLWSVFSDTTSRVSNFVPQNKWDPSLRVANKQRQLFPPFYAIRSIDVFAEDSVNVLSPISLANSTKPSSYCRFGRAAFHSYIVGDNKDLSDETIIEQRAEKLNHLIQVKLLGDSSDKKLSEIRVALTVLSFRCNIDFNPCHQLSSQIISSGMRVCVGINEDRTVVQSAEYPEPALALAASSIIAKEGWVSYLKQLQIAISTSAITAGPRGEIVSQIVLCMAFDTVLYSHVVSSSAKVSKPTITSSSSSSAKQTKPATRSTSSSSDTQTKPTASSSQSKTPAHAEISTPEIMPKIYAAAPKFQPKFARNSYFLEYINAKDFLCLLTQRTLPASFDVLSNCYVNFRQFVSYHSYGIDKDDLNKFFVRGAGIVCNLNQDGDDFVIPMFVNTSRKNREVKITPDSMSCILVQSKNYANSQTLQVMEEWSTTKLTTQFCGVNINKSLPYVSLVFLWGRDLKTHIVRAGQPEPNQHSILIQKVDFKGLVYNNAEGDEVNTVLNELLTSRRTPFDQSSNITKTHWQKRADNIVKDMYRIKQSYKDILVKGDDDEGDDDVGGDDDEEVEGQVITKKRGRTESDETDFPLLKK